MNSKNIWIINEYAGSPYHGMTFRHYYLAKELVKAGHKVTIFTSSYSHFKLQQHRETKKTFTKENIDGIKYIWVKMPAYKAPKSPGRIKNWFLFALKLFFIPLLKIEKPDVILVSSLPLHPVFPGKYLANKYNAKLIFEVRDIWPLSAIELGGYSPQHPFIRHLQWVEDFAYRNADEVVSVLANAYEHMKIRGLQADKFHYIPNGIDIGCQGNKEALEERILNQFPKNKFVVGYAGTFGIANALETFISAAKEMQDYQDIAFVLVGDGKEKETLIKLSEGLSNVFFVDPVRKNQVPSILEKFDLCYIGWKKHQIYKYGISANKIFDYMYSAKPILHAFSGKGDLVSMANCGITVEAQNSHAVAKGIEEIYSLSQSERNQMGLNGKAYVVKNHSYARLSKLFEEII